MACYGLTKIRPKTLSVTRPGRCQTDQQETAKAAQRALSEGVVAGIGMSDTTFTRAGSAEPAAIRDALAATRGFRGVTGEISYIRKSMVPPKPIPIIAVQDGLQRRENLDTDRRLTTDSVDARPGTVAPGLLLVGLRYVGWYNE